MRWLKIGLFMPQAMPSGYAVCPVVFAVLAWHAEAWNSLIGSWWTCTRSVTLAEPLNIQQDLWTLKSPNFKCRLAELDVGCQQASIVHVEEHEFAVSTTSCHSCLVDPATT